MLCLERLTRIDCNTESETKRFVVVVYFFVGVIEEIKDLVWKKKKVKNWVDLGSL